MAFTGQDEHTVAVDVHSVDELVSTKLGFDPRIGATPLDWLSLTGQAALEMTAGAVFEDSDDELTSLRQALAWYPDDVWRYVVACDWHRIDQESSLSWDVPLTAATSWVANHRCPPGRHHDAPRVRAEPPLGAVLEVARHDVPQLGLAH